MAKQKTTTKAVATTGGRAVAATGTDSDLLAQLARDAGSGFEEATRDAYAIPFLTVLQDLSPQTKKKMAGYVEGAKPGLIFHTVSKELFTDILFIPCYFSQVFIEWVPRGKGGGFVAAHPATTPLVRQAVRDGAKNVLPNGNELSDTRQHFGLLVRPDGTSDGCLIAMKSTQLKVSRRWMSMMRAATIEVAGRLIEPPMFAWAYKLATEEEANDQGSWSSWTIQDRTRVASLELYNKAKAFGATMKAGGAKINYDDIAGDQGHAAKMDEGDLHPADLDDDIPA